MYLLDKTNRFHFAIVCSVIDAQMRSQRGKNKKMARELPGRVNWLTSDDFTCNGGNLQSARILRTIYWFNDKYLMCLNN